MKLQFPQKVERAGGLHGSVSDLSPSQDIRPHPGHGGIEALAS